MKTDGSFAALVEIYIMFCPHECVSVTCLDMTRWRAASPPPTGETPAWPPLPGGRGGGVTSCEAVRMRRYSFLMSSSGLSSLQIAGLRAEDAGLYRCGAVQHCTVLYCTVLCRCRVDFEQRQTVIWWSHLTVAGAYYLTSLHINK